MSLAAQDTYRPQSHLCLPGATWRPLSLTTTRPLAELRGLVPSDASFRELRTKQKNEVGPTDCTLLFSTAKEAGQLVTLYQESGVFSHVEVIEIRHPDFVPQVAELNGIGSN